jgi:hypothetical protein
MRKPVSGSMAEPQERRSGDWACAGRLAFRSRGGLLGEQRGSRASGAGPQGWNVCFGGCQSSAMHGRLCKR